MTSSKMVNDRYRSALYLHQTTETNAEDIGAELAEVFAVPEELGVPEVDWAAVIRRIGWSARTLAEDMVAADAAHIAEKADDHEPRARRDLHAEALFDSLSTLRPVVQALFGDQAVREVGLAGAVPREPIALHRQGRTVHENLPHLATLTPATSTIAIDIETTRGELLPDVEGLGQALEDVAREARELEVTQVAKDETVGDHDSFFGYFGRALEALYGAAGATALAARVRPSGRRPGRVDDALPDDGDTPGDEPAPTEPPEPASPDAA
ncbi:hypothetical protein [Haliangium sp.]|uniref:hypothetical protein n=1 Tax=Haliangium sp. TaxID=2663208 RepID=UPI003D10C5DC